MNHDTRDNPGDDDARLDELLASARWPEPSLESTDRLRRRWSSLGVPRRVYWPVAVAAALFIAVGSAAWFMGRPSDREIVAHVPASVVSNATTVESAVPSRPATLHERLALLSASPPTTRPTTQVTAATRVHRAIDAVVAERLPDALPLLKPLTARDAEARLMDVALAEFGDQKRRIAAVRLLSEVGTAESLPLLVRFAWRPDFAAAAMPGVSRLGGTSELVKIARATALDETRGASLRALLARGDAASTDAFLALVLDPGTRDAALAALHDAPEPAVRSLLQALDHRRVDYRLAAAKSLGSVCDHGGLGARLQQMVRTNDNRREALAALVSCPGKPAADFLSREASVHPSIGSEVRAVQSELANIFEL